MSHMILIRTILPFISTKQSIIYKFTSDMTDGELIIQENISSRPI